jgi:hypothetical protein
MSQRFARVQHFLESARVLREPSHPLGAQGYAQLPLATGLSPENVVWALENAFEVEPSQWDLDLLCRRTPESNRAHVLLSANVFTAALRAIAIALASAPEVFVRPSRREPLMVELLAQAAPGQFQVVNALQPQPGDHCWIYGKNSTLVQLRETWPRGVILHTHGDGYGVIVVQDCDRRDDPSMEALARAVAQDVAPYDQRGCLSPRIVLVEQDRAAAGRLWQALAAALAARDQHIPTGRLDVDELAAIRRYHDTICIAGDVLRAGSSGAVGFETHCLPWILPPIGRVVHVRTVASAIEDILPHASDITTLGLTSYSAKFQQVFPALRIAKPGNLQRPKLDGPVDLRNYGGDVF